MDTFDDMESTNARTWDDETQGRNPPRPTIEHTSRPRQHRNGVRPVSLRPVQGSKTETPRTIPGRPTMSSTTERKAGRADLITWSQHRPKARHGRFAKDQTLKKAEWAKQNAINTKRKQDYLDREANKAAKSVEFLGLPADDNFPAEGYYFWSESGTDPSSLLGDNLQLLDDIRTVFGVYIDFVEALGCIRLRSKSRRNIERGVAGIKAKIQYARTDSHGLDPLYIVEPPAVHAIRSEVSPKFQDSQQIEKQPIIKKIVLSGLMLTAEQLAQWEVERQSIIKQNRERVFENMVKALAKLRTFNKAICMRVNLGSIELLHYKKEFKNGGYPFRKFLNMMEETRTKARFEKILGGVSVTSKILDLFSTGSSLFEPTDSLKSRLADVEAKHSLLVFAHGPSRQSVRIEADIDMVQVAIQGKIQKAGNAAWQIGAIKYYHNQHNARKTRLAVSWLSLDNFDTCLEIITEDVMFQPLNNFRNLVVGSISGTSTFATGKLDVSYPAIKLRVPEGIMVEKVCVRSALQYKLQNTSYIAEVAINHRWNSRDTKQDPLTDCGISFYHKDWDLLMTQDEEGVQGLRVLDMRSLFPDESNAADGFSGFLDHVQTLQRFVNLG